MTKQEQQNWRFVNIDVRSTRAHLDVRPRQVKGGDAVRRANRDKVDAFLVAFDEENQAAVESRELKEKYDEAWHRLVELRNFVADADEVSDELHAAIDELAKLEKLITPMYRQTQRAYANAKSDYESKTSEMAKDVFMDTKPVLKQLEAELVAAMAPILDKIVVAKAGLEMTIPAVEKIIGRPPEAPPSEGFQYYHPAEPQPLPPIPDANQSEEDKRKVLHRHSDGQSADEIAEALDMPKERVEWLLPRTESNSASIKHHPQQPVRVGDDDLPTYPQPVKVQP